MGPSSPRNVLIVDDDDDVRFLIHRWLSEDTRSGMIWEATDPATASALAQLLPVDVTILDYTLAQGTAADCVPALRHHLPESRIIVYTAGTPMSDMSHVLTLGANDLVSKVSVVTEEVVELVFGGRTHLEM
jgi:DNA-binding NarL/FixJ family response regulator